MKPNLKELFDRHSIKTPRFTIMDEDGFERAVSDLVPKWREAEVYQPVLNEPLMGYDDDGNYTVLIKDYQATVLAYSKELGVIKARCTRNTWYEVSSISSKPVEPTHWMPLPETP